jgi:hypothetical protein
VDLFQAIWKPLLASVAAAAIGYGAVSWPGPSHSPIFRLLAGGSVMGAAYVWILLFAMGQKAFYFDLLGALRRASLATPVVSHASIGGPS